MTTSRVVCRIAKLKMSGLSGAQKHNEREFDAPNADSNKSELNQRLIGDGHLRDLVLNRINSCGAKIINSGQNASNVAIEIVLSASPQYFRDNPDDYGVFEKDKLDVWVSKNIDFLKLKYGDNLVCVDLHLERNPPPHIKKKPPPKKKKKKQKNNKKNPHKKKNKKKKNIFFLIKKKKKKPPPQKYKKKNTPHKKKYIYKKGRKGGKKKNQKKKKIYKKG
ncbi:plasmid recombination protein [Photobacterium leiognathi]|uniref:plasmid recombination protein n=1 Tax=Photobacterium leiognathi TaxID=553611 RepID=UPI002738BD58|nr:plasmid recombination protein [Photobacterium leiognathi]